MAAAVPFEQQLLRPVDELLTRELAGALDPYQARLEVLEGAAALHGGFDLPEFRALVEREYLLPADEATAIALDLVEGLNDVAIPAPLAFTALAREPLSVSAQRQAGAYYTDFRLAQHLAAAVVDELSPRHKVIDPASGTGILLVALALRFGQERSERDEFLRDSVHAADLSEAALRGTALALASLTSDLSVVAGFLPRLRTMDSVLAGPEGWSDVAPHGFQLVIGNPPWEKLKVSRHEHLRAAGVERHYGADYEDEVSPELLDARERMRDYVAEASATYEALRAGGEVDLYHLFISLAIHLVPEGGQVALLLPAGLIRAKGTYELRRHLFAESSALRIGLAFNHARFFGIDSRFKFLALNARIGPSSARREPIVLEHLDGSDAGVRITSSASISRSRLKDVRPDLTIPEVRGPAEWKLFQKMAEAAPASASRPMRIVRELDMTRDRQLFSRERRPGYLPLIEGRMVHQFRHCAKAYISGSGRSAIWETVEPGAGALRPQFWINPDDLDPALRDRVGRDRVGFCDIAGQTNERGMHAARIPAGVICGNKVPTIEFEDASTAALWLALVNSFAFDWLLRRVLTTTVNYFLLRSVPLPSLSLSDPQAKRLIELADLVEDAYVGATTGSTLPQIASWRAEMDALAFSVYGVAPSDALTVMADFPLLDRGQPPLPGEDRSTITRDLVITELSLLEGERQLSIPAERAAAASALGALAYVPAEAAKQSAARAKAAS